LAPYLPVTRAAGIALWGCRPQYAELNRKVLTEEAVAELLDEGFISVRGLVADQKFEEAKELAKQWVFGPLGVMIQTHGKNL